MPTADVAPARANGGRGMIPAAGHEDPLVARAGGLASARPRMSVTSAPVGATMTSEVTMLGSPRHASRPSGLASFAATVASEPASRTPRHGKLGDSHRGGGAPSTAATVSSEVTMLGSPRQHKDRVSGQTAVTTAGTDVTALGSPRPKQLDALAPPQRKGSMRRHAGAPSHGTL
eukprot:TRINITY_DN7975_c0_g4_i1.p3 TRINITY_DN7975_c0_g4~~TRINITY_DN7975_c0_g4_i1.p3  ORF type:complete len:193 (+),score=34.85 TRINITY_DN7975_c0_g4_i1:59-580(+)